MWPAIDHSLLSPSGKISKRARKAALKREHDRLFPTGFWDQPKSAIQVATEKRASLLQAAFNLREMAARGMNAKRFIKEAVRLEQQAAAIINEERGQD